MNWKDIIKAETLQSVAKDMEALFRATDWRTVMRGELVDLHERIEGMSKEEIEDLRRFNAGLHTPKRQEYTGMVDKLLELKGKDILKLKDPSKRKRAGLKGRGMSKDQMKDRKKRRSKMAVNEPPYTSAIVGSKNQIVPLGRRKIVDRPEIEVTKRIMLHHKHKCEGNHCLASVDKEGAYCPKCQKVKEPQKMEE